jgi:1,4-dihydroxy-2-naphthoyl-CoA hydrolase
MPDADLTALAHQQMPLSELLALQVQIGGPDRVEATGRWRPEYCTAGGVLHGGYLMALADSVGAMCAFFNLPEGAMTSTIESKTNFFRPVSGGTVRFVAAPVNVGRTVVVVQTDVADEQGRLVSRTTQTQAVIHAP